MAAPKRHGLLLGALAALLLGPGAAAAHQLSFELGGDRMVLRTDAGDPNQSTFVYKSTDQALISQPLANPITEGSSLVVTTEGPDAKTSGVIDLDPAMWQPLGTPPGSRGYLYRDPSATRSGVKRVLIRPGQAGRGGTLAIKARGGGWPLIVNESHDSARVVLTIEQEAYCADFGGVVLSDGTGGEYVARGAPAPGDCEVCGNGTVEPGEACDDGNLIDDDGCTSQCTIGSCNATDYASTLEAIEDVIFDGYQCTNPACHGAGFPQGNLDLETDPITALVNVPGTIVGGLIDRVEPGEPDLSLLYLKLLKASDPGALPNPLPNGISSVGTAMPFALAGPLVPDHLRAVELWIRNGAPADTVVEGTADLLGACLPPPQPNKIPVPEPPAPGTGVQLQQTAWALPRQSEDEICMATYYDFTQTGLVPANAVFPCGATPLNPTGQCFRYHYQRLLQDPQSHHSIIHMYFGDGVAGPGALSFQELLDAYGPFTYKFNDPNNPQNGAACDPTAIDPATGFHADCSGRVQSSAACIGYGPSDFRFTGPAFSGSQEPFFEEEFVDGVYSVLPMAGVIVWNSHAFNLTDEDTTMAQYLNIEAAAPADQVFPLRGVFHTGQGVFGGFPLQSQVPPFGTLEVCRTATIERYARLFRLSSHTHRFGVRFRVWGPPNTPCQPGDPACVPRQDAPMYFSTEYTDPVQLEIDPPMALDSGVDADRTFLYCSLYDNGSTPTSPHVKLQSTSPFPPPPFDGDNAAGGPCDDTVVACVGGTNQGQLCGGDDGNCPGSTCDACPVRAGLTTEDEMYILLGSYYVDSP